MARRLPPRPKKYAPSRPGGVGKSAPRTRAAGAAKARPARKPESGPRLHKPERPQVEGAERLNRFLAGAGVGSRRAVEELILTGRVAVNGEIVRDLATKVDPNGDEVSLDGQRVRSERHVYFAVNKPKGYVSTNNDPAGRPRVVDLVAEVPERVYAVGRLDEDSIGLMLLTNDGELANKLAHPKFGVEKVYRALVAGAPEPEHFDKLVEGVWLSEGKARAKRARPIGKRGEATLIEMVLAEGKNREVRRMLAKLGHKVMTLQRVAIGPISLKGLKPGAYRHLTSQEVDLLRRVAAGEPVPTALYGERDEIRNRRDTTTPRRGAGRHERPAGPARRMVRPSEIEDLDRGEGSAASRPRGPKAASRPAGPGRPPGPQGPGRPAGPKGAARPRRPLDAGGEAIPRGRAAGAAKRAVRRDREIEVRPIAESAQDLGPPPSRRPRPAGPRGGAAPGGPGARRPAGPRGGIGPGPGPGGLPPRGRRPGPAGPPPEGAPPSRRIIGLDSSGPGPGPRRPSGAPGGPPSPAKRRPKPIPKPRRSRGSEGGSED